MACGHREHTRNTFIDIDTREIDAECTRDPRRNKTWHASAALPLSELIQDDANDSESLADEHTTRSAFRCQTYDFMDADDVSISDDMSTCASETAEVETPPMPLRGTNNSWHPQLETLHMLSASASPVLFFQMLVADPAIRSSHTVPGALSPSITPVQIVDQGVAQLPAKVPLNGEQIMLPQGWSSAAKVSSSCKPQQEVSEIDAPETNSTWTCRMVRNIPNDYTRDDLVELLDSMDIQYDFLYLPIDWKKGANLGYAFVNLVNHKEAVRIQTCLKGFSAWTVSSEKVCDVVWGKPDQQSLEIIVERFRNSPVMHPDVPERFKPLLFINQRRIVMPAPTRKLQQPRAS